MLKKKLTPSEKTKQQEAELLFLELSKHQLTPQQKTHQQEIELFFEEQRHTKKRKLHQLTGKQKTYLQEVALFLAEQNKKPQTKEINHQDPEDFSQAQMVSLTEQARQEQQTKQQLQEALQHSEDKYLMEKEFTDVKTIKKMLKVEGRQVWLPEKQKIKVKVSKIDASTEKTLEKKLFTAPDVKEERKKKEVEFSHLQTALIESWHKGYELDIEETPYHS